MNKREAQSLLAECVAGLRSRSYPEWRRIIGEDTHEERTGPSGVTYQIEWEAFWDAAEGGAIRVMVSIDDGSLIRATFPLTTSFLVVPPGD